jgi:hypothetical protein
MSHTGLTGTIPDVVPAGSPLRTFLTIGKGDPDTPKLSGAARATARPPACPPARLPGPSRGGTRLASATPNEPLPCLPPMPLPPGTLPATLINAANLTELDFSRNNYEGGRGRGKRGLGGPASTSRIWSLA